MRSRDGVDVGRFYDIGVRFRERVTFPLGLKSCRRALLSKRAPTADKTTARCPTSDRTDTEKKCASPKN
jgi:hypothetical protein